MWNDLRLAARSLRHNPGFAATAIVILALGIGTTTSVFSVVYGVIFRPLPFPAADRLVQIVQTLELKAGDAAAEPARIGLSPDQFVQLREHSGTLAAVGSYAHASRTLTDIPTAALLNGASVAPSLFAGLGVRPFLGRTFADEDGDEGAETVVILSHRVWVTYFGRDESVIDTRATLDDERVRVIGVMPDGFGFPSLASASGSRNSAGELEDAPEFWLPARHFTRPGSSQGFSTFMAFALIRDGVSVERATAEVRSLLPPLPDGRRLPVQLVSARHEIGRRVSSALTVFQLSVALVLLVACVNVTNLLLARAAHRHRELAIRVALGASRLRITRDALAESLLLAIAGGVVGVALTYVMISAAHTLPPHVLPRLRDIRVDGPVLGFGLALSLATGLAVGLWSAFRAGSRRGLDRPVLSGHDASTSPRLRPSGLLVIVEIATAVVLLAGAGLLANSFTRLMRVDHGIDPTGVATFSVTLPPARYPTTASQEHFYRELSASLQAVPGTDAVAARGSMAIQYSPLTIDAQQPQRADITVRHVTPGYFRALGIASHGGRDFRDDDRSATASTAIVSESFARRYFGAASPVGRHLGFSRWSSLEIVGVVADANAPRENADLPPALYLPLDDEAGLRRPVVMVRTSSSPAAILQAARSAVGRIDPLLAVYDGASLEQLVTYANASARLYSLVSLFFAVTALMLAALGLYGLLSYSVGSRTRELGIRTALGAAPAALLAGVIRQGLAIAGTGIVFGLAGALMTGRFLETLLFGITPHDPVTLGLVVSILVPIVVVACYVPARRATRVDPVVALRAE
jgi:putative ABC transport system permease protein